MADPVDHLPTLWTRQPPSGPAKQVSRAGWAVSAVVVPGCQKASCFYSWTLWTTTLTLRIRLRPSGSAPIDPQGRRVVLRQKRRARMALARRLHLRFGGMATDYSPSAAMLISTGFTQHLTSAL